MGYIEESGNVYDKLRVIKKSRKKSRKAFWDCICDCGNSCSVRADRLRAGITTSCGCDNYNKMLSTKGLVEGESQFNSLLSSYKSNATRKNIEFTLTKEEFKFLTEQNCHYCGQKPSEMFKKAKLKGFYIYNGVDRIDSNMGYNTTNTIPCCTDCNYMKSNIKYDEFIFKIKTIYLNIITRT